MIRIKGTLNIIWIADVWNDEGCVPYLVSNEAIREQHAVIAGHRILRFLTKMTPSSWIFWASSNTSQWKQTPRMMTTILRGFFEYVLRHIHALDCTSRFTQGNKWKIISSFFGAGSGSTSRFRVRSRCLMESSPRLRRILWTSTHQMQSICSIRMKVMIITVLQS